MQFCISITDPKALEKWNSIPRQRRSKYIEEILLKEEQQKSNIEEIKSMLLEIMNKSSTPVSNVNLDADVIDEILNM